MNKATGTRIRICTFKGLQNLAMYAAQEQGIFAAHDLDVEIEYTSCSKPQLRGLARSEYDLIQTAPDNVVNFDNNPATFGIDASTAPHIDSDGEFKNDSHIMLNFAVRQHEN